jgi:hypothetical protein
MKPMVRIEITNDGTLNELCKGSLEMAISFLIAKERDINDTKKETKDETKNIKTP